jgi:hypothetical protein
MLLPGAHRRKGGFALGQMPQAIMFFAIIRKVIQGIDKEGYVEYTVP